MTVDTVETFSGPDDAFAFNFVDRVQELAALREMLRDDKRAIVIYGEFGTGKTALARMFVQQQMDAHAGEWGSSLLLTVAL